MSAYRCPMCSRERGTWECGECGEVATPMLVGPPPQDAAPLHDDIRAVILGDSGMEDSESARCAVPMYLLARWADAAQALARQLAQAAPWVCPDCGPHVHIEADGYCAGHCGAMRPTADAIDTRCVHGGCDNPATVAIDWVGPPRETWFRFCTEHDPRKAQL